MAYRAYTPSFKYWDSRVNPSGGRTVEGDVILNLVCEFYCIEIETIKKVSRKRSIVWPRQVCMYLMAYYTAISLFDIGKIFCKDHTTVIHSKDTVQDLMCSDEDIKEQINYLIKKLDDHAKARYQTFEGSDTIYPGHA